MKGVAVGDAAAELVDQFAYGNARRREFHAGIFDPARNRIAAQTLASVATLGIPPFRPLLDDLAHPEQGLEVVDQGRQAEQADLERIRWLVPRQSALALDAFEQGGFLAADISAGAAPQVQSRTARRQLRHFDWQQFVSRGIFVAQIDVDVGSIDNMRRNERAFEESMHVAQQIEAIFEGSRFALVGVDGHQPRTGLTKHRAPFATRRKTGAAKPAEAGIVERFENVLLVDLARTQASEQFVAALLCISIVVDIRRDDRIGLTAVGRVENLGSGCVQNIAMSDLGHRRAVTKADTGRTHHANAGASFALQIMKQLFASEHRAGEGVADTNGDRRDIGLALLHDIEMGVEGRGLEHFGKGELHLVGKGGEMGRRYLLIFVLDQVQMLERTDLLHVMNHWNLAFRQLCRLSLGMPDAKMNQEAPITIKGTAALP